MKPSTKLSLAIALALPAISTAAWKLHHHYARIPPTDLQSTDLQSTAPDLIPWRHDLEAAQKESSATGKPLLIEFEAMWCPDCHALQSQTWSNPKVAAALQGFIPVSIDIDASPALAKQFGVDSIPSLFILHSKTGQIQKQIRNEVMDPQAFLAWLE